jgi:putative peptidoglycan lipid II flippase
MALTTDKRQIARAASIVMFAFAVSRILGLVRDMVIAEQFGTDVEMDAYRVAFRVPDLIFQLIAGGALASAFIPTFTTYLAQDRRAGAWQLASTIINLLLVVLTCLALIAVLIAPWLVEYIIAPGFDAGARALTVDLMRVMLISTVIFGVSGVVMGALNAHQHFVLPAIAPMLYNLAIIGSALFLATSWGVMALAVGVVVGSALHLFVQIPGLMHFGARYSPRLTVHDPGVREVGRLMGPRVLALAVVQINLLVSTNLASRMAEGSVSALAFAWLLMLLPVGVLAQAVATAAFPTFSAQVARGDQDAMRSALAATLRAVFVLSLPAMVGLIVLREPLIELLFERGAFDQTSTEMVAWALLFFALGLTAHAGLEIVNRAYFALHDTKTPLLISGGAMLLNVALSLTLPPLFAALGWMEHGGLALAISLATILEVVGLLWIIRSRLGGLEGRRSLPTLGRSVLAAALMALLLVILLMVFPDASALLLSLVGIGLGALVYFGAAWALGVQELQTVVLQLRRRPPVDGEGGLMDRDAQITRPE